MLPQVFQHSDRLAGVHQGYLNMCGPHPEQREQSGIKTIPVVYHRTSYACSKIWRMQSGDEEVPTVSLWPTLEVMDLDQSLQLVANAPLCPLLIGKDGEEAVNGVACLA